MQNDDSTYAVSAGLVKAAGLPKEELLLADPDRADSTTFFDLTVETHGEVKFSPAAGVVENSEKRPLVPVKNLMSDESMKLAGKKRCASQARPVGAPADVKAFALGLVSAEKP